MRDAKKAGGLVLGGLLALAIGHHEPTDAQQPGLGGGFGGGEQVRHAPAPASRVYLRWPVGAKAIPILEQLERPISMPFDTDTPLVDALEYVRQATVTDAMETGIPIYVDERGLQESEQSLQSPIRLNLEGIPLRMSLELMLAQLDLVYTVHADGLIEITSKYSENAAADPILLILDEVRALRAEVEGLKAALGSRKE